MADLNILPEATGITFVFPVTAFLTLNVTAPIALQIMNKEGPWIQLKILFTVLLKKVTYILDGLRMSKLTENVIFLVNSSFKHCVR